MVPAATKESGSRFPINLARNVMGQILDHGKVTRGYLGVVIQPITPAMSKALNLNKLQGALVSDVSAKGPAQACGRAARRRDSGDQREHRERQQRTAQYDLDDAAGADRETDGLTQRQHEGHRRETRRIAAVEGRSGE